MENKKEDMVFAGGLFAKAPSEKAKEFIKLKLSVRVVPFLKFIEDNNHDGWVNIDMRKSKKGDYYFTLNTWKPEKLPNPDTEMPF